MTSRISSTLTRYKPAIFVLTALAAGYTIYYIHSSAQDTTDVSHASGLQRRHAVARRRRQRERQHSRGSSSARVIDASELLAMFHSGPDSYGNFETDVGSNHYSIPMVRRGEFPPVPAAWESISEEDRRQVEGLRQSFEEVFMTAFLCQCMPVGAILNDPGGIEVYPNIFAEEGFMFFHSVASPILLFNLDRFENTPARQAAYRRQGQRPLPLRRTRSPPPVDPFTGSTEEALGPRPSIIPSVEVSERPADSLMVMDVMDEPEVEETLMDGDSEYSWQGGDDTEEKREGQSLLNMLYHIAEDQSKREGYMHRGVSCNSCNAHPIRGIRYRCANCVDFDLCEQCEALQFHPKTHLFYKIRIPAPSFGNPRQPQPVWYPGRPSGLPNHLSRDKSSKFSQDTGFEISEVEALWDQFKCLAAADWSADPIGFGIAIDRQTFDKCFVQGTTMRPPPSSLIYDRLFSFYDTDGNGLIGFGEFLMGLSTLRSKNPKEKMKRIFHGYDHDDDGYVTRKDFLLMFRSYYAFTKEIVQDIVAGNDDEYQYDGGAGPRDNVAGTQPISSAYAGSIPYSENPRLYEGKSWDAFGDRVTTDNNFEVVREGPIDEGDYDDVIGDMAEISSFGKLDEGMAMLSYLVDRHMDVDQPPLSPVIAPLELHRPVPLVDQVPQAPTTSENLPIPGESEDRHSSGNTETTPPPSSQAVSGPAWPPEDLIVDDIIYALGHEEEPVNITNPEERSRIRRVVRERIHRELERPKRLKAREAAIAERHERREFYINEPNDLKKLHDNLRVSAAELPASTPLINEPTSITQRLCLNGSQVAHASEEPSENNYRMPPPLDHDVGREIFYQITQEGLNEILDLVFRQREDLSLTIKKAEPMRFKHRHDLEKFSRSEKMIELCLFQMKEFQRKWRMGETKTLYSKNTVADDLRTMLTDQEDPKSPEYSRNLLAMAAVGMITTEDLEDRITNMMEHKLEDEMKEQEADVAAGLVTPPESKTLEETQATFEKVIADADRVLESTERVLASFGVPENDLDHAVATFDAADTSSEKTIMEQDLSTLLASSGYMIAEEVEPEDGVGEQEPQEEPRDPTLPQFRPNSDAFSHGADTVSNQNSMGSSKLGAPSAPVPDSSSDAQPSGGESEWSPKLRHTLKYLTMLECVRAEDQKRGGPGRLSFEEFEQVMNGPKNQNQRLGFLGEWIQMATF